MINGGHPQRYMQMGLGQKYQHQTHHGHQNHQQQQNNAGGHNMGHQHTFSSGTLSNATLSNATPHFTSNNLHNGSSANNQIGLSENYVQNTHWQRQLQLVAESRQAQSTPHHHGKKEGAASRVNRVVDQIPTEESAGEGEEERNRATTIPEVTSQIWSVLDFSGQGLRMLSTQLFAYDFLTKLYLDHNRLSHLNPVIGQLRRLTYLDISNNQIMDLPEEIGMLVNLKELLFFDNNLRSLPYEIGHLYKLEMLGIEGNPLDEEIKEQIMLNGTKALVTQLRENAERKITIPLFVSSFSVKREMTS